MDKHYAQALLAFLLAQLLMASINVYFFQKKKEIEYMVAVKAYMKAEIGYFIIGFFGALCLIFILSDFLDLGVNRKDLLSKETLTHKEKLQAYFKTCALLVGAFLQAIAFAVRKKGKAAIEKMVDKG
jgi:hypothetical protein